MSYNKKLSNPLILLVVAFIIIFSIYTINYSVKKISKENIVSSQQNTTDNSGKTIKNEVFLKLKSYTGVLSEDQTIKDFCENNPSNDKAALKVINAINNMAKSKICYILDKKGTAILNSNYSTNNSLTMKGNKYAFRPYFKNAINGHADIYPAVGYPSKEIGLYSSAPIYSKHKKIIGVAVIKYDLSKVTEILKGIKYKSSLVNYDGIILASNNNDLLFKYIYNIPKSELKEIKKNSQFLNTKITPMNILIAKNSTVSLKNNYSIVQYKFLDNKWSIMTLGKISDGYFLTYGQKMLIIIFLLVSAFLLILVVILHFSFNKSKRVQRSLKKLFKAVEQSDNIIMITDADAIIEYVNPKFELITGYSKEEAIGKTPRILKSEFNNEEFYKEIWETITAGKDWRGEFLNKRKDGTTYWEANLISPVKNSRGLITGFIAIKEDITEKKEIEKRLNLYATTDEMTGTLNRRTGLEILESLLKNAKTDGSSLVVGFVDVNGLKEINDNLGHSFGDELIIYCVNTIKNNVRESDEISRLGGDEFLIILPKCNLVNAEEIWSNILKDFEKINLEEDKAFIISVSHGFCEYAPQSQMSLDELIAVADEKMYEEKKKIKFNLKSSIKH